MEKLVVQIPNEDRAGYINFSPTLRPLIGNVPNLKHLLIKGEIGTSRSGVNFSIEDVTQLMATTPLLEELTLDFWSISKPALNIKTAISTWRLPKLLALSLNLKWNCQNPSSIFHHFPASFPRLESITSYDIKEIDDQAVVALSQLKYLREFRLPDLEMTKSKNIEMIPMLSSTAVLGINKIDDQGLQALSQLEHLRQLCLYTDMTKSALIKVITSVPSLAIVEISEISDVCSPQTLIDFLTSTATYFRRNLEIRLGSMSRWTWNGMEVAKMKEMMNNGGPMVEMDGRYSRKIRYNYRDF